MMVSRKMNEMWILVLAVLLSFATLASSRQSFSVSEDTFCAKTTSNTCLDEPLLLRGMSSSSKRTNLLAVRGGAVQEVATLEEVEKIIADEEESGKLVVLYFTANNCPPCKMIAPIYEELSESEEFREKVLFVKINVDDSPETAQNFNVDGWPAFFFLKKGKVLSEMVGGNAAREGLYAMISLWSSM